MTRKRPVAAVIFDLDGTLTRPSLEFDTIREEIGVEGPILEGLERLDNEARRHALEVLERHEARAARHSRLREGARETLAALRGRGVRLAILTRNSRRSLRAVLERHGLEIDASRTREDSPVKPSPDPVLSLCRELAVEPEETLLVGDYRFDLEAANAAGATSVLLSSHAAPLFANLARHTIRSLPELLRLAGAPASRSAGPAAGGSPAVQPDDDAGIEGEKP